MGGTAQLHCAEVLIPEFLELPKVDEYVALEPNYDAINGQTKKRSQRQAPSRHA